MFVRSTTRRRFKIARSAQVQFRFKKWLRFCTHMFLYRPGILVGGPGTFSEFAGPGAEVRELGCSELRRPGVPRKGLRISGNEFHTKSLVHIDKGRNRAFCQPSIGKNGNVFGIWMQVRRLRAAPQGCSQGSGKSVLKTCSHCILLSVLEPRGGSAFGHVRQQAERSHTGTW